MQITIIVAERGLEKKSENTMSVAEGIHETTEVQSEPKTIEATPGRRRSREESDGCYDHKAPLLMSAYQNSMEAILAKYLQQEADLVKLLVVLKQQDDDLDVKPKTLLTDYDGLYTGISDMMKSLQHLQDRRQGLKLNLSDLQQRSKSLRPVIKEQEAKLEKVRASGNKTRRKLEAWKSRYIKCATSFWREESMKRCEVDRKLEVSKEALESEKAERMNLEARVELYEQNLEAEKVKRMKFEADVVLSEQKLETEKEKMLCIICLEAVRDTLILPCGHLHCCNSCLLEHRKNSNTCPTCRSPISMLLTCQHSVS